MQHYFAHYSIFSLLLVFSFSIYFSLTTFKTGKCTQSAVTDDNLRWWQRWQSIMMMMMMFITMLHIRTNKQSNNQLTSCCNQWNAATQLFTFIYGVLFYVKLLTIFLYFWKNTLLCYMCPHTDGCQCTTAHFQQNDIKAKWNITTKPYPKNR